MDQAASTVTALAELWAVGERTLSQETLAVVSLASAMLCDLRQVPSPPWASYSPSVKWSSYQSGQVARTS